MDTPSKLHTSYSINAITKVEIITPPTASRLIGFSWLLISVQFVCKEPAKSKKPNIILRIILLRSVCSIILLISEKCPKSHTLLLKTTSERIVERKNKPITKGNLITL